MTATGPRVDDLEIVPLESTSPEAVAALITACGVSRFLVEEPYVGDSRDSYLLQRILGDAERDDALALGALRKGRLAGLLVLRFPAWDREHFGFTVARVEHLQGSDASALSHLVDRGVQELQSRAVTMCSARLSGDALVGLHCLEARGFRFQELTLSPWRDLASWEQRSFGVTRPTEAADVPSMRAIARRAFRTDRFHRDTGFTQEAADGVYDKWVSTWHTNPGRDRYSRVLALDGQVAGFFMYEVLHPRGRAGDPVVSVVLDAVGPDRAGRGHGFKMYCDVLDAVSTQARFATVTVVAANAAAVNLCMKLGFRLTGSGEVTLHWWAEGKGGE